MFVVHDFYLLAACRFLVGMAHHTVSHLPYMIGGSLNGRLSPLSFRDPTFEPHRGPLDAHGKEGLTYQKTATFAPESMRGSLGWYSNYEGLVQGDPSRSSKPIVDIDVKVAF